MNKLLFLFLIFAATLTSFGQQIKGISLDEPETITDTSGHVNVDSLQSFHKEIVTGAYMFANNAWFTSDEFTLIEKLEAIKNGNKAFQYFFFARNGKIEEGTYLANGEIKFVKDATLSYGAWFFDKDKLNVVLNGFSVLHGKFQYRIVYSYIKTGNNLTLKVVEKKLSVDELIEH